MFSLQNRIYLFQFSLNFFLPTSERFAAAENRDGAANVAPHQ
jgi:hypothetical protein